MDSTRDPPTGVQREVEVILLKQVASYLAMPIFLVDPEGTLVYYNEPAERLLGYRYEETGEMPIGEWSTVFVPRDEHGNQIPAAELPLGVALMQQRPAHGTMWIDALDDETHHIMVTAFPLVGQHDRKLGAVAIFWETTEQ
jgi:PAS domain-containing protein